MQSNILKLYLKTEMLPTINFSIVTFLSHPTKFAANTFPLEGNELLCSILVDIICLSVNVCICLRYIICYTMSDYQINEVCLLSTMIRPSYFVIIRPTTVRLAYYIAT